VTDTDMPGTARSQPAPAEETSRERTDEAARIAELEAQLEAARAEAEQAREDWLRAKAETENVRRRAQEDVARAHRYGIEGFASALLAVKDSVDAALKVENVTVESFREGVELTGRQLDAAFSKFAITEVAPLDEKFDPHRHQAISQVPSDAEPNTVVNVLQKGFLLHDRVLRPALVIVAGPRAESEPGEAAKA
jgi:molecular chaperone GrpE